MTRTLIVHTPFSFVATHIIVELPNEEIYTECKQFGDRLTVVGLYNEEQNTMNVGVAVCSQQDNFCKKTGRELALKRATEAPIYTNLKIEGDFKDALEALYKVHQDLFEDSRNVKRLIPSLA